MSDQPPGVRPGLVPARELAAADAKRAFPVDDSRWLQDPPVVIYMRYQMPGEQVVKYLPADADEDTALRRAYALAADMIESNTAAPSGVRYAGVTHSMADLRERYGDWWDQ